MYNHLYVGQSADAEETLRQTAQRVDQIKDPQNKANLIAASGILAGLRLEQEVIYRLLRRDIMQESTVYRSILAEGLEEGKAEAQRAIALNFYEMGCQSKSLPVEPAYQLRKFDNFSGT